MPISDLFPDVFLHRHIFHCHWKKVEIENLWSTEKKTDIEKGKHDVNISRLPLKKNTLKCKNI